MSFFSACLLKLVILLSSRTITTTTAFSSITTWQPSAIVTRIRNTRNNQSFDTGRNRLQCRTHPFTSDSTSTPHDTLLAANTDAYNKQLLDDFITDFSDLKTIRPPMQAADFSVPSAIISAGSSYTRLWRSTTWEGHQCPPLKRYYKHVLKWNTSSTARKILPAVACSAIYSLFIAFILRHVPFWQYHVGSLTKGASAAMASLTAPLALLLTLRTNASLGRLMEARGLWGRLVLHSRSLAGLFVSTAYASDPRSVVMACRYLAILGWSAKSLVRDESFDKEEEVVNTMLRGPDEEEARWLIRQPKRNVAITIRLRHILSSIVMEDSSNFMAQRQTMENKISEIEGDFGGCERILTSPIPPTYSRHLSRIMVMYLGLLPFGLVASGIPSLGTAVASAVISYMLIGIDEIGMEIENPFPLLPLQQLSSAIQTDVANQLLCHRDIPQLRPLPGATLEQSR